MKSKGKHKERRLSAVKVRNTTDPGMYGDGNGLYLKVDHRGAKRWIQRIVIQGKRRDLGLGPVTLVSLAEAREAAFANRKAARTGGDPLADKRREATIKTFEAAARTVHMLHLPTWSNAKQGQQWINTLEAYAFPHIGAKRIDEVTSADVLSVLSPIWTTKPETASRVRRRIGTVMKWAIGQGWRTDDPARDITAALPKRDKRSKHFKALPYSQVSAALGQIKASKASVAAKLALELLVLTATRSSEVREAKWDEFDGKVWTIPAGRMKGRKTHKVPLSPRCMKVLREAKKLNGAFVFQGASGKPLSDSTLSKLLREQGIGCVPHGFRTSFRTWAAEKTEFSEQVCEFALAHVVGDANARAYQRSDLFEKRRRLMNAWSRYLMSNCYLDQ